MRDFVKVKKVKEHIAVNGFPSHSYGTLLAIYVKKLNSFKSGVRTTW